MKAEESNASFRIDGGRRFYIPSKASNPLDEPFCAAIMVEKGIVW